MATYVYIIQNAMSNKIIYQKDNYYKKKYVTKKNNRWCLQRLSMCVCVCV